MRPWPFQQLHISWLIAAWSLGVVVGVISVMHLPGGWFSGLGWLLVGLILWLPVVRHQRRWMVVLMLVSGAVIGLWRGSIDQQALEDYQMIIGQLIELEGKVAEDPDIDKRGQTVLRLQDIQVGDQELAGGVWVVTSRNDAVRRSDRVRVSGKLVAGFGSFAASIYQAKVIDIERPIPGDVAVDVRNWFSDRVRQVIPEPESALGLGYLLGIRRAMPPELLEALKIAGLTHVIVASGYNLTILVRLSRRLFIRVSKYLATLSSVGMILGFMAVTGISPSMSRAGLVAGLSLAAWYYGRTVHPLVLLPFAACITLLINPGYGWNDLGWQLSFTSFAGVIILAPLLQSYFFGDKPPGSIRQIIGETLSAQIVTLPIILVSFEVMSNISLLANVLVLPLVPLAMLLVFLSGGLAFVPYIGVALGTLTAWLLGYMVWVAKSLSSQPWAQADVSISWLVVGAAYTLIGLAAWWMWRATKLDIAKVNIVE